MPELTIQPTAKFLRAGFLLTGIAVVLLEIAYVGWWYVSPWLILVPPLLLLWPASHAIRRRFTRTVIAGDRLRYETGLTSKSTRTIQLSKIQDVRVDQKLLQRVLNIGDLSIETAGETSRLTIQMVDNPQTLADEIMNRAQHGAGA